MTATSLNQSMAARTATQGMKVGTINVRTLKSRAALSPRATVAFSVLDVVIGVRKAAQSALVSLRGRGHHAVAIAIPSISATR